MSRGGGRGLSCVGAAVPLPHRVTGGQFVSANRGEEGQLLAACSAFSICAEPVPLEW